MNFIEFLNQTQNEHDSTDHLGIDAPEQKKSIGKMWKKDFDKVILCYFL